MSIFSSQFDRARPHVDTYAGPHDDPGLPPARHADDPAADHTDAHHGWGEGWDGGWDGDPHTGPAHESNADAAMVSDGHAASATDAGDHDGAGDHEKHRESDGTKAADDHEHSVRHGGDGTPDGGKNRDDQADPGLGRDDPAATDDGYPGFDDPTENDREFGSDHDHAAVHDAYHDVQAYPDDLAGDPDTVI
ncbi:hypothetical protein CC117_27175 [Parafrankia colletiae]|uniref:Uncharacterized protein n=1 Tax=Parafrankia colletiae TaxID=573497 RepID=A0A1S1QBF5_9ACTN|nr:hypothetical protein [Parafrankia colletiae]MCK9903105.1 hypothetical protein [Frankia sp. Cpl3]OHV30967.1 hypothetical protein CC117_27175 [Parafrankia colletiae]